MQAALGIVRLRVFFVSCHMESHGPSWPEVKAWATKQLVGTPAWKNADEYSTALHDVTRCQMPRPTGAWAA